jgi:hypothetical protein
MCLLKAFLCKDILVSLALKKHLIRYKNKKVNILNIKTTGCSLVKTFQYCILQSSECTEQFRKDCFIEYRNEVRDEKVKTCRENWKRDCNHHHTDDNNEENERVCSTRYETGELSDCMAFPRIRDARISHPILSYPNLT